MLYSAQFAILSEHLSLFQRIQDISIKYPYNIGPIINPILANNCCNPIPAFFSSFGKSLKKFKRIKTFKNTVTLSLIEVQLKKILNTM